MGGRESGIGAAEAGRATGQRSPTQRCARPCPRLRLSRLFRPFRFPKPPVSQSSRALRARRGAPPPGNARRLERMPQVDPKDAGTGGESPVIEPKARAF